MRKVNSANAPCSRATLNSPAPRSECFFASWAGPCKARRTSGLLHIRGAPAVRADVAFDDLAGALRIGRGTRDEERAGGARLPVLRLLLVLHGRLGGFRLGRRRPQRPRRGGEARDQRGILEHDASRCFHCGILLNPSWTLACRG